MTASFGIAPSGPDTSNVTALALAASQSSYTQVYSVMYDSRSGSRRAIFSQRETSPTLVYSGLHRVYTSLHVFARDHTGAHGVTRVHTGLSPIYARCIWRLHVVKLGLQGCTGFARGLHAVYTDLHGVYTGRQGLTRVYSVTAVHTGSHRVYRCVH